RYLISNYQQHEDSRSGAILIKSYAQHALSRCFTCGRWQYRLCTESSAKIKIRRMQRVIGFLYEKFTHIPDTKKPHQCAVLSDFLSRLVRSERVDLPLPEVVAKCSIQLSYERDVLMGCIIRVLSVLLSVF